LSEWISKAKAGLEKKLKEIRKQKQEFQSSRSKLKRGLKRKGVHNNSSKKLMEG
jgi:hypothetical protein